MQIKSMKNTLILNKYIFYLQKIVFTFRKAVFYIPKTNSLKFIF